MHTTLQILFFLHLQNVPDWLFTLAFSLDPLTKYYACLAICALVSNKQFEAAVLKSGTLGLVDPFVATHDPVEFALHDDLHHGDGRKATFVGSDHDKGRVSVISRMN